MGFGREYQTVRDAERPTVLGRQQRYFDLPAAAAFMVIWVVIAVSEGLLVGLKYVWLLVIGVLFATWIVRMRLQVRGSRLEFSVLGPWRRSVALQSLESISWKHTGAAASKGTLFVRDRHGGQLRIPVGRFDGVEVWGNMLLDAATRSDATVDDASRRLLTASATTKRD